MKKTILLIGLGVAFAAVSAWVFCSGGRSARAVRAKFRLGGAILTLVGMTTLTGCTSCYDPAVPTCYDPAPPTPTNQISVWQGVYSSSLRNGDVVRFSAECDFESVATISLRDDDGTTLKSEDYTLAIGNSDLWFTIEAGDYLGPATLVVRFQVYGDGVDDMTEREVPILIVE